MIRLNYYVTNYLKLSKLHEFEFFINGKYFTIYIMIIISPLLIKLYDFQDAYFVSLYQLCIIIYFIFYLQILQSFYPSKESK